MSDDTKFGLSTSTTISNLSEDYSKDPLIAAILKAAKGGSDTADYFTFHNTYSALFGLLINSGDISGWEEAEDENDLPLYYVNTKDSDGNNYYISLQMDLNVDDSGNLNPNGTTQTIDGTTYNGVGTVTANIGYNDGPFQQIFWVVGMTSSSAFALTGVTNLLKPIVKAAAKQLASKLQAVYKAITVDKTPAEVEDEVATADAEGVTEVAEDASVAVETAAGVGIAGSFAMIGIGVFIAVVFLVVDIYVLHVTLHRVRFWNVTKYRAVWSLYVSEGKLVTGPVKFNSDGSINTYTPIPGVVCSSPVPGAKKKNQAQYGDLTFNSASVTTGLGYAMQIKLLDTDDSVKYTCTLMFDIPFTGDNSTSVTFDDVSDLPTWYKDQEGMHKTTQQKATSSDGIIEAYTTYDYLNGKHVAPVVSGNSNEAYYYQSVIVLHQTDLTSSNTPTK